MTDGADDSRPHVNEQQQDDDCHVDTTAKLLLASAALLFLCDFATLQVGVVVLDGDCLMIVVLHYYF